MSSFASKAGMSTGCDEARFHAKPKHERMLPGARGRGRGR